MAMITSKFHLSRCFCIYWEDYDGEPNWKEFDLSSKCDEQTYLDIKNDLPISTSNRIRLYVDKRLSKLLEPMEWRLVICDNFRLLEVKGSIDDMILLKLSSNLSKYTD